MVDISAAHPGSSFQVHKDIVLLYPLEVSPGQVIWFVQSKVYRHKVYHFQPEYLTVFDGISNSAPFPRCRNQDTCADMELPFWNDELTHGYQLLRESPKTTTDIK